MPLSYRATLCALFSLLCAGTVSDAEGQGLMPRLSYERLKLAVWKQVDIDGVPYIPWEEFCRFYHFNSSSAANRTLNATSQNFQHRTVWLSLGKDTQSIFLQGHLIELTHPLIYKTPYQWLISKADCFSIIDPILRSDYIAATPTVKTIVIDVPHGGSEQGITINENAQLTEATYILQFAEQLAARLRKLGYTCVLTRKDEHYLSDQARVDRANAQPDAIFLSLRLNHGYSSKRGIECYTVRSATGFAEDAAQQQLQQRSALLGMVVQSHVLYSTKGFDAGLRGSYYSYLRSLKHPACILYLGYLSNGVDLGLLLDPAYQTKLLDGLEQGILHYIKISQQKEPA